MVEILEFADVAVDAFIAAIREVSLTHMILSSYATEKYIFV